MSGMPDQRWITQSVIVWIIQFPANSRMSADTTSLGTKVSVISWIWVIVCSSDTTTPTTKEARRIGAASLAPSTRALRSRSMTWASVTVSSSRVHGADDGADDEVPAVDEDEQ